MAKICYLGNFNNPRSDTTEKHIQFCFEKFGHQVIPIYEKDFALRKKEYIDRICHEKADLFFFHKAGVAFGLHLSDLMELLNKIIYKKACWFFDPVYLKVSEGGVLRERWIETVIPFVDYMFITDHNWIKRHNYKNLYNLKQGIGTEDLIVGKYEPKYDCKIAFLGNVYGDRIKFVQVLKREFGEDFKVFSDIFNQDLCNFCASCKIIIAPQFPSDTFYWSSRIYMTLGSGGFLIHPKISGLEIEDGLKDGKHYVGYKTIEELIGKIKYYLANEKKRKKIQKAGYEYCIKNLTYCHRVKKLLDTINVKS